jgi:anthranilate synthase component 1
LAKGGIVFDSDPYDEWMETINKLGALLNTYRLGVHNSTDRFPAGANTLCITSAEEKHLAEQEDGEGEHQGAEATGLSGDAEPRISLVAG